MSDARAQAGTLRTSGPTSFPGPGWLVAVLLSVFAASAAVSLWGDSATFDETSHVPAGFTYADRLDFRLNPEHPPLAKMWAALPLVALDLVDAPYRSRSWTGEPAGHDPRRTGANQWSFGFRTLNGPPDVGPRRDPDSMLIPARLMMLVPGLVLGLIVYRFSCRLHGVGGGLLSATLYCLSPTMLAHTRLVTTDLPVALGFSGCVFALLAFTERPGPLRAIGVGSALGAALLVKFSAILLVPILGLLALVWWVWPDRTSPGSKPSPSRILGLAVLAVVAAYAVLWAGYGFRRAATPDPGYRLQWEGLDSESSGAARAARFLGDTGCVPEAYAFGLVYALGGAERRLAFLNGETSVNGWWYYFPEAFLLKTSPAVIAFVLWSIAIAFRKARPPSLGTWFVVLPVVVYAAVTLAGSLNLGHRHLAPVYPFLFVASGAVAAAWTRRWGRRLIVVLVLVAVGTWGLATPRYLSYFNLLAGGERGGWRFLVDSNIDWGQDLKRLADWIERHGVEEVHLAYFGTADPAAYGIPHRKVLFVHDFRPDVPRVRPAGGDWLAVSVTLLQGVYVDDDWELSREALRRRWITDGDVREWLRQRDRATAAGDEFPGLGPWLVRTGRLSGQRHRALEDGLLGTWLGRVRDRLRPDARIGGSILVYRIPQDPGWLE